MGQIARGPHAVDKPGATADCAQTGACNLAGKGDAVETGRDHPPYCTLQDRGTDATRACGDGTALVSMTLASRNEDVRRAVVEAVRALERTDISEETSSAAELVLAEAMTNIVKHAYSGDRGGWIRLHILREGGCLCVTLQDGGKPMPGLVAPEGKQQPLDVPLEDLPEGGFGWFMIRSLVEDLRYRREKTVNLLCFRLTLPG